jgi:hypothetical protein
MADSKVGFKKNSLDSFVKEIQRDIVKFKEAYKKKHEETPDHYPLELSEDNSGLWFEFFMEYCQTGKV